MLRQSSSRSHRSKKLRPSHSFQAFLLAAVAVWIVYQLTHSYGDRSPVAVETGGNDAEPARRRLGRKGFVHFAGHASVDGIAGVSSDDSLSKAGGGEGDEEDREAEEDDGVDGDVDDADDGLAAEEEDDGMDFQSQNGSREDEPKAVQSGTQNGSIVPPVNSDGGDSAAVLLGNATGGAADGSAPTPSGYSLKNTSSVDLASLRDSRTAGDVANSFTEKQPANNSQNHLINQNGMDNSGHGMSS